MNISHLNFEFVPSFGFRMSCFFVLLVILPCTSFAGDRDLLVGTWKVTVFQDDGRDRLSRLGAGPARKKDAKPRVAKLVFTKDACYVLRGDGRREVTAGLANAAWKSFQLDESSSPKSIDIVGLAPLHDRLTTEA